MLTIPLTLKQEADLGGKPPTIRINRLHRDRLPADQGGRPEQHCIIYLYAHLPSKLIHWLQAAS